MIKAILNNPYRILGVYVDADVESLARAFFVNEDLSVLKPETDFPIEGLPVPVRTKETVREAFNKVLDEINSYKYKFFWFVSANDDKYGLKGIDALKKGDLLKANELFASFSDRLHHNEIVTSFMIWSYAHSARSINQYFTKSFIEEIYGEENANVQQWKNKFRDSLIEAVNGDPEEAKTKGFNSWTEFLFSDIEKETVRSIKEYGYPSAKREIKPGEAASLLNAAKKLGHCISDLQAMQLFTGINRKDAFAISYSVAKDILTWVDNYLIQSTSPFKYDKANSCLYELSDICPNLALRRMIDVQRMLLLQAECFRLPMDIVDNALTILTQMHKCYNKVDLTSCTEYQNGLLYLAPEIVRLKHDFPMNDERYVKIVSAIIHVGYSKISTCLFNLKSAPQLTDAAVFMAYLDLLLDKSLLDAELSKIRESLVLRFNQLGGIDSEKARYPGALRQARYNKHVFMDEDDLYNQGNWSTSDCAYYVKQYPQGKYLIQAQQRLATLPKFRPSPTNNLPVSKEIEKDASPTAEYPIDGALSRMLLSLLVGILFIVFGSSKVAAIYLAVVFLFWFFYHYSKADQYYHGGSFSKSAKIILAINAIIAVASVLAFIHFL